MIYDLIIKNGMITDGTGRESYRADLGITDARIRTIGDLKNAQAKTVIDAQGRAVVPGLIEPHSHVDMTILFHPSAESYLMQGVTTVVTGNCGHGMAPMGDEVYRAAVDADRKVSAALNPSFFDNMPQVYMEKGKAEPLLRAYYGVELDWHSFDEFNRKCQELPVDCNIVPLVGHSAIRNTVMGMDCERAASEEEIAGMEELLKTCMEQGAFGFSTGRDPTYRPSVSGTDEEIIRLLGIVKAYDGIFTSHTANFVEGHFDRMAGYEEFFRQVKASGVKAHISHVQLENDDGDPVKAVTEARELLAWLEEMEESGVNLTYDIIPVADVDFILCPYLAGVFSPFVRICGSRRRFSECLGALDFRKMLRTVIESGMLPGADTRSTDGIFGRLTVTAYQGRTSDQTGCAAEKEQIVGRLIGELAREAHADPLEYAMDLLAADPDTRCNMHFQPCREAYDLLIYHRLAMPCIDNSASDKEADYSLCGDLPEYPAPFYNNSMTCYILNSRFASFEETIHHMTGMVAERFGISRRGLIREGYYADIVVMDRTGLRSYENEWEHRRYPDGIEYVIVNGKITIDHKVHTGAGAGLVLRKEH